jgi:nicotinate-nucleotide adenylyltransferase
MRNFSEELRVLRKFNVAIFGGSFDMPTSGHVMVVTHLLLNEPDINLILVVPCFDHVEKPHLSAYYHRFEMCNRAFSHLNHVEVSDVEAKLGGPSFTANTVKHLYRENDDWNLRLVLGADLNYRSWEGWEEVEKYATPLLVGRAGIPTEGAPPPVCPPCSSTMVRDLIRQGEFETAARFVPRGVLEYIKFHKLYQRD